MFGRSSSGWDQDTDFDSLPLKMVDMTPEFSNLIAGHALEDGKVGNETIEDNFRGSDIEIGRSSSGWDQDTDFDALPLKMVDMTSEFSNMIAGAGNQYDEYGASDGEVGSEAEEFESPEAEQFPMFKTALRHFQETMPKTRPVRIDTEKSFDGFVCEKAVKEIERRLNELRAAVEQHTSDHHGPAAVSMRKWDEIMGAAEAVADLSSAKTASEAMAKMPEVPLTLPDFAKGKAKCFQDDDITIVMLRFAMPDGSARTATTGSKSQVDEEGIQTWLEGCGYDPVTILGVVPAIASVATGNRLIRDAAAAALEARGKSEVAEQDEEPVVLIGAGPDTSASLAALMLLQQKADGGDQQAARELAVMRVAAQSPVGQKVAKPLLDEASRRLAAGRADKTVPTSMGDRYAVMSAFV